MKQNKRSLKKAFISFLTQLLVVVVVLFLAISAIFQIDRALFIRKRHLTELKKLELEYEQIRTERKKYREAIRKLQQDEYIELLARRQFRMVKPVEKAYIVVINGDSKIKKEPEKTLDFLINENN